MIDIKSRIFPTSSFPSSAEQTREDTVSVSVTISLAFRQTKKKMEVFFFRVLPERPEKFGLD